MTGLFHTGERFVQWLLKSPPSIDAWAQVALRDKLVPEHQLFFRELPYLIVAARDAEGLPWCSVLSGEPGFAVADNERVLRVEALPREGDPLREALAQDDSIGLLGIELHSQRRNRLNGRVLQRDETGFQLAVAQSYGNCPKYIVRRAWRPERIVQPEAPQEFDTLPGVATEILQRCDTFFIATGFSPKEKQGRHGLDASHRGGRPGLLRVEDAKTISFPDYSGNNLYNTLGNLVKDARAGLLIIDFKSGGLLHLQGEVEIDWAAQDFSAKPPVRRRLRFHVKRGVWRRGALPLRFVSIPGSLAAG